MFRIFSRMREFSLDPERIIRDINNARRKKFEASLPKGETYESAKAKVTEELSVFLNFLITYVGYLVESETPTREIIAGLKSSTKQNIIDDVLLRELWILRYAAAHIWFINFDNPKDQNSLEVDILLVRKAFRFVLEKNNKIDHLPWLEAGLIEYLGSDEIVFRDLNKVKALFADRLAQKMGRIAFDATEGRLAGKLHDSVVALVMATVKEDHKVFHSGGEI